MRIEERLVALGLSSVEAARKAPLFRDAERALGDRSGDNSADSSGGDRDGSGGGTDASNSPRLYWFVPGRIEVLGKHTDYAGGRSLLCTVERGFSVVAAPRDDARMRVIDVGNQTDAHFIVDEQQPAETRWRTYPATVARRVARNFSSASRGASRGASLRGAGRDTSLRGADIAFASDLPRAAGLSSSTAFLIAIFTVLAEVNRLDEDEAYRREIPSLDALASYLGCIENGRTFGTLIGDAGVGTHGGSQDHSAILRSQPGHLVRYAYSPPGVEQSCPLPPGLTFVVGSSGVAAEKTGAARDQYNRASSMVTTILDRWRNATGRNDRTLFEALAHRPSLDTRDAAAQGIAAVDPGALDASRLADRAQDTNGREATSTDSREKNPSPREAGEARALDRTALDEMRAVLRRSTSHDGGTPGDGGAALSSPAGDFSADALIARVDQFVLEAFEIIPAAADALAAANFDELGRLVDASQHAAERWLSNQIPETIALARLARARGAIAASAFGAGFGGSVWALVPRLDAQRFADDWSRAYLAQFPSHAERAAFFVTAAGPPRVRL